MRREGSGNGVLSSDCLSQAVAKYQANNQPSSENFQNVGRPVALALLEFT